ncbi:hypothetical protein QTP88_001082 [Uroleucon formosanum]
MREVLSYRVCAKEVVTDSIKVEGEQEEYSVEKILNKRIRNNKEFEKSEQQENKKKKDIIVRSRKRALNNSTAKMCSLSEPGTSNDCSNSSFHKLKSKVKKTNELSEAGSSKECTINLFHQRNIKTEKSDESNKSDLTKNNDNYNEDENSVLEEIENVHKTTLNKKEGYNKSDKCHICERYLSDLPPMLEKKFKIIKGVIEYYKQFKIVEDDDSKKIKLYEDKLKNEIENKNKNMRKVRDHDHLTGEYRGAAHSICNLNYQNPRFIPIVFHNLSGYDAHLFIKEFGNDNKRIKLIPNNEEKYISFSKMMPRKVTRKGKEIVIYTELRFIDSFKFLPSSLDKLTNNLRNDSKLNLRNKFKELSKYFPEEHLDLVTRKLAYPYEYMDCEEKFNETCLPPIEKIYSSLTNKNITKEEYENSQKIWKVFNIQNMREFTSLYNKIDVLLSTDIIEHFRDISLKYYKLDPMWYYTTPGFAWDCMVRMTNIKLDLLTDIDQILIFESGIRGGLSQCSQRYSKANNKYMGDKFKKKEESIFLQYLSSDWLGMGGGGAEELAPTGSVWVGWRGGSDWLGMGGVEGVAQTGSL